MYICWLQVKNNRITAIPIEGGRQQNYLGNAEFEIISANEAGLTIKSVNNIYGDEGKVYVLVMGHEYQPDPNHPFLTVGRSIKDETLTLYISQMANPQTEEEAFSGWYENSVTNTKYEGYFILKNGMLRIKNVNNPYTANYNGDAEFELVSYDSESFTLRSTNNVYGDEGTVYVLHK